VERRLPPRRLALRRPALVALALALLAGACNGASTSDAEDCAVREEVVRESGLTWTDLSCGDGDEAVGGAAVTVHYVGRLEDGDVFDSSRNGEPFTFLLGAGRVIEGWEEGVRGMRVGGTRRLVVPPGLAYGEDGFAGVVPGDATLTFDIELLEVRLPDD
jgi:FKBP-type peptidyl-prolyl cis-trans isomerase